MKPLLLVALCTLLFGVAQAALLPSWVVKTMEYNDLINGFLWKYIMHYVGVYIPALCVCQWLLPLAQGFTNSIAPPKLSGTAQFDACMKGTNQFIEFWYYGGGQENQVIDFSI